MTFNYVLFVTIDFGSSLLLSQCKAYANDLKVDSLSAFLSKYKQRMSLFKRNCMTSAAQGNYTSSVSSSSKVDTEVIELLSDDDEVIDLTTTPTKAKG